MYKRLNGVRANFICTPEGEYQKNGSSRELSNEDDRRLLVHLRSLADAVIVGGSTARREKYAPSTKFETYVFTKNPESIPNGLKKVQYSDIESLSRVLETIRIDHPAVLVEAGPLILGELLRAKLIDQLCLTIAGSAGSPVEIAKKVFGLPKMDDLDQIQQVGLFRFCIWNL